MVSEKKRIHLEEVEFADYGSRDGSCQIDFLIGFDYIQEFLDDKTKREEPCQPVAPSTNAEWFYLTLSKLKQKINCPVLLFSQLMYNVWQVAYIIERGLEETSALVLLAYAKTIEWEKMRKI